MTEAACHCGAVRLTVAAPPTEVTDCNCSICRSYGVLWAYYTPSQVEGWSGAATDTYVWGDKRLAFHRCKTCGCVTHWQDIEPPGQRMGVNTRLMDPGVLAGVRVRRLNGAGDWSEIFD